MKMLAWKLTYWNIVRLHSLIAYGNDGIDVLGVSRQHRSGLFIIIEEEKIKQKKISIYDLHFEWNR